MMEELKHSHVIELNINIIFNLLRVEQDIVQT
jgi:hypothetical protein